MTTRDLGLLDDRDGDLPQALGRLRIITDQLQQAVRAREARGPATDNGDPDLDPFILRVKLALDELITGSDLRRERPGRVGRFRHCQPFFAAMAAVSFGMIWLRSPTMPRSQNSKIGALASLLIATMFSEDCMPTLCWIAPEIPAARYSFGAPVLPVWPIWAAYGYQPASTTARVAATAELPPKALASSSQSSKPSALPRPRPPATRMSAPSMSTSAPRASPRSTIVAFVDQWDSATSTSSTVADPSPGWPISNA